MMHSPFFSVIINTHNSEDTIINTLDSVLNQKFKNFEIVLVDDNSKDMTLRKVQRKRENTNIDFKIIRTVRNAGVSYARNLGISFSSGKFIAFLDGDDLWKSDKLYEEYKVIKKYKLKWVFSNYEVINENYESIGMRIRKKGYYYYDDIINNGNPVGMLTVAVSTEILKSNSFRKIHHEDYDLWIRLAKKGIGGFLISKNLASYMKHKNSLSGNKFRSVLWTYNVFRKNNISFFKTILLLKNYVMNIFRRNSLNAIK